MNNGCNTRAQSWIQALQGEIISFKGHLQSHQRHLDNLADRSKRHNLVIFGFPEPDQENADILKKEIIEDMIGQKTVTN